MKISESYFSDLLVRPVPEVMAAWAKHNGCPLQPGVSKPVGNSVKSNYAPCRDEAEVILWEIRDGGHTWPGGKVTAFERAGKIGFYRIGPPVGYVSQDISASELMWEFFKGHARI